LKAHTAATDIQRIYRGFVAYLDYLRRLNVSERCKAAVIIQRTYRGFVQYSDYVIMQFENHAATTIQRYARGFSKYSQYCIIQYEIVKIQSLVRGFQERRWIEFQHECAISMQSVARMYLACNKFNLKSVVSVLRFSSSLSMRRKIGCKVIQNFWRTIIQRRCEKKAALIIERFFITVKEEVDKEIRRRERNREKKRERRRRKKKEEDEMLLERIWLNTVEIQDRDVALTARQVSLPRNVAQVTHQEKLQPSYALSQQHLHQHSTSQQRLITPVLQQKQIHNYQHQQVETMLPGMQSSMGRLQGGLIGTRHHKSTGHLLSSGSNVSFTDEQRRHANSLHRAPSSSLQQNVHQQVQRGHLNREDSFGSIRPSMMTQNVPEVMPPAQMVSLPSSEDMEDGRSDVSGITSPSVFVSGKAYLPQPPLNNPRYSALSRKDMEDDRSLEDAWADTEVMYMKQKRQSDREYSQRNGARSSGDPPRSRSMDPYHKQHHQQYQQKQQRKHQHHLIAAAPQSQRLTSGNHQYAMHHQTDPSQHRHGRRRDRSMEAGQNTSRRSLSRQKSVKDQYW